MIRFRTGDILGEDAEALVNTVNCVGAMGRGVALQFKKAFPANFAAYKTACKRGEVRPGRMFVYNTGQLTNPRFIINFPTKRHWRGRSRLEDIAAGLEALANTVRERHIRSIAIPPLGSGLGGLPWSEVRPRIEAALRGLSEVSIVVFEPSGAPEASEMAHATEAPRMTPGRAALVGLINRYLGGLLDPFITLLEVHKLMYFMQAAGEPLKLQFSKAAYGPYSENLRHVFNAIEGYFIEGYADGGDSPNKPLQLVPAAVENAMNFLENHDQTRERFERVALLVEGFESAFGLELLATVHWVLYHEAPRSKDEVISKTYDWNVRKRAFSQDQITLAMNRLIELGWVAEVG